MGQHTRGDARPGRGVSSRWLIPALATAALAFPTAAPATGPCHPPAPELEYTVLLGGSPIGYQRMAFHGDGARLVVRTEVEISASFLFVPLIDLTHQSEEVWIDGRFHTFDGRTVDNGRETLVSVSAGAEGLTAYRNGEATPLPATFLPGGLWCRESLEVDGPVLLFDTVKGRTGTVEIHDAGEDDVEVRGAHSRATRYELTGAFEREVWFAPDGTGLRARTPSKLGPGITLELDWRGAEANPVDRR